MARPQRRWKNLRLKRSLTILFATAMITISYQNCGGFKASDWLGSSEVNFSEFAPTSSSPLRMLSVREFDKSLEILLGETAELGVTTLPPAVHEPFDNSATHLKPSEVRIMALESAANIAAERFVGDSQRLSSRLGCTPSGFNDEACLKTFVDSFITLAFRGMADQEVLQQYLQHGLEAASKSQRFNDGVFAVVSAALQDPLFIYRWEEGAPVRGQFETYKLTDLQLASKLSFFLTGAPPTRELLEFAQSGGFSDEDRYRKFLVNLLDSPEVLDQMDLFHASWLGYQHIQDQSDLARDMRKETKALIDHIVFQENLPWTNLLTYNRSYTNGVLADIYDIPADQGSDNWAWREYTTPLRRGILSHGSFLSVGTKFGDTSPTQRGYNVQKALFCGAVPAPPMDVDPDVAPPGDGVSNCKVDRYRSAHLRVSSCAGCHQLMDTIGFGLERFDATGGFRVVEDNLPECRIDGQGEVYVQDHNYQNVKIGEFMGPAELANVAISLGSVQRCLVTRLIEFDFGKNFSPHAPEPIVDRFGILLERQPSLKNFLLSYLSAPEFRYRKEVQ